MNGMSRNTAVVAMAMAMAMALAATSMPAYARCNIEGRIVVVNNLKGPGWPESKGQRLTGIGVIHRVGKDNRAGVQSFVWEPMEYMPEKESDHRILFSYAQGAPPDHWTVVVSYRLYGETQDTVFTIWPHNLNNFADELNAALQGATSNEIKTLIGDLKTPPKPGIAALIDPGIKLITALMVSKGPSLAGYNQRSLRCDDDYSKSKKNITITIGGDALEDKNKVWIWTPTRGEAFLGDLVPTLAKPNDMMEAFKQKATQEAGRGGGKEK